MAVTSLESVLIKVLFFSGNTPLMYAIAEGHDQVVDALLKAGADVEAGWPAKKAAK